VPSPVSLFIAFVQGGQIVIELYSDWKKWEDWEDEKAG
jgi:hypothetical protein